MQLPPDRFGFMAVCKSNTAQISCEISKFISHNNTFKVNINNVLDFLEYFCIMYQVPKYSSHGRISSESIRQEHHKRQSSHTSNPA